MSDTAKKLWWKDLSEQDRYSGSDAPGWCKDAAERICDVYMIGGEADPGYIANTIWGQYKRQTGEE